MSNKESIILKSKIKTFILDYSLQKFNFPLSLVNDFNDHFDKYRPVMIELKGLQIDGECLNRNLLLGKTRSIDSLYELVKTNSDTDKTLILSLLKENIFVVDKLSSMSSISKNFLFTDILKSTPDIQQTLQLQNSFFYSSVYDHRFLDLQSSDIAQKLIRADIPLINNLIDLAYISEAITFISIHHQLVGILSLPVFFSFYNTYTEPGNFIRLLRGIRYSLSEAVVYSNISLVISSKVMSYVALGSFITCGLSFYYIPKYSSNIFFDQPKLVLDISVKAARPLLGEIEPKNADFFSGINKQLTLSVGIAVSSIRAIFRGFWISAILKPTLEIHDRTSEAIIEILKNKK